MMLPKIMDPRRPIGLFAFAVILLTGGLYVVFDYHLESVGKEIASSWLQSEAVEIQEGNLLSSITKNQRVLLSSQFIKGLRLVDIPTDGTLIEIGEKYDAKPPLDLPAGEFKSVSTGFLHRRLFYRLPEQPDFVLSFQTYSDFLIRAYLAAVASFLSLLGFIFISIRHVESKRIEAENKNRILLGEVAARVAHDIRSPLSTLNAVLETIEGLPPTSQKLLTSAIMRIREIGMGIEDHSRLAIAERSSFRNVVESADPLVTPELIAQLLDEVFEEKRIQYRERADDFSLSIPRETRSLFCALNADELLRSLSNLIDNAVEASVAAQPVRIALTSDQNSLRIAITDRGAGISQNDLAKIGRKGFTKGKNSGTGIGVYYANRAITAWSGKLEFESSVGVGTTASIILPIAATPDWVFDISELPKTDTIVIVDDDPTLHLLWQDRLAASESKACVEHFFDADSAGSWAVQNRASAKSCLLLTDFNLNSRSGTGIDVLERFGLSQPAAVLVTNAYSEIAIRKRCEELNVRIMPKSMMSGVVFS